jgi:hypothetical protein
VDGVPLIDNWSDHSAWQTLTADKVMSAGVHEVRVEFYDSTMRALLEYSHAVIGPPPPPPSTATTRLSWFYTRNTDIGTMSIPTLVNRHKVILLSGSDAEVQAPGYPSGTTWLEAIRQELGNTGRATEKIVQYVQGPHSMGPSTALNPGGSCPASFEGFTTSWTSRAGDFCNRVHPHESWFLHNGAGQRLYENGGSGLFWYLMNPASAGWRNYVASKVPEIAADYQMDGLFVDNVWQNTIAPRTRETNSDGICQECGTDAQWQASWIGFLDSLNAASGARPVQINTDQETDYPLHADGFMVENFLASWGTDYMPQDEVIQVWQDVESHVAAGKEVLLVGQGDSPTQLQRFRYSHAGYLMVAGPQVSYRFHNAADYRTLWDFPEYGWNLGAAAGPRFAVGSSGWRRNFLNGAAIVNISASSSQTFVLGGTYLTPLGATVTSVTLGPRQGMALRASG